MTAPLRKDTRGLCFGLGYGLLLSHNILVSFSVLELSLWVQGVMLLCALVLFAGCILRQRLPDFRTVVAVGGIAALGILCALHSGKLDVLYFAALLFLCRYCPERSFFRADLAARAAMVLLLLYLSGFDFVMNTVFRKYTLRESYAFGGGFNNPNSMGMMLFLICTDILLLQHSGSGFRGRVLGVCLVFTLLILLLAGTRTAAVLTILAGGLLLLYSRGGFRGRFWRKWGWLVPLAAAAGSFLACYAYRAGWPGSEGFNTLVTGRLAHLNAFISRHDVTLFGREVVYLSSARARELGLPITVCDNVYVYLLHNLGLVPFLGWLWVMVRTAADLLRRDAVKAWLMFCVMLLYGFMENTMANVMFFPFVFYCARAMFQKDGDDI